MARARLFLDIETKIGHPAEDRLLLVGYALDDGPVLVAEGPWSTNLDLRAALADPTTIKVTQTKYDLRYLKLLGWDVQGDLHDTTVMAHLMNENTPLDLDWLAWHYAGLDMDKRLRRSGGKVYFHDDAGQTHDLEVAETWAPETWVQFEHYNVRDVDGLRRLYYALRQRLTESDWLSEFEAERVPYTNTLLRMETRGLPVDVTSCVALAKQLAPLKDQLGAELLVEAGLPASFNLNSGDQVASYLFSRVLTLTDTLVYDKGTVECLKSCLDGEHEDCEPSGVTALHFVDDREGNTFLHHPVKTHWSGHVLDLLPEGFTMDKLGRDRVHGHWSVKGRGLAATPPTRNKVTGELGKRPSTSSPELLYMHAGDPWVKKLCLEYRKLEKLLTTYLSAWPKEAINERGETYGQALQRTGAAGEGAAQPPRIPSSLLAGASASAGAGRRADSSARGVGEAGPVGEAGGARGPRESEPLGQPAGEFVRSASVDSLVRDCEQADLELGAYRLYGRFNQTGTVTGRLSSSGPNLQNVPARGERGKQIRGLFRAPEGKVLVVGDYDQLELRLMAHFSEDAQMLRAFREGKDPHLVTAQGIFGQNIDPDGEERGLGKTLNFAMGYGAGPKKVAQVLSLAGYATTKEVAQGYLAEMSRHYKGFFRWKQQVAEKAKRTGNVKTIGGGRRRLRAAFKDVANWKLVSYGERQAVNAVIQGSAADIIRRAMVRIDAEVPRLHMLAQVHDELVFEAELYDQLDLDLLQDIAQTGHGFDLRVPLLFEPHVGYSWASAKEGPDLEMLFEEEGSE